VLLKKQYALAIYAWYATNHSFCLCNLLLAMLAALSVGYLPNSSLPASSPTFLPRLVMPPSK
jgi:hypothetical protein